MAQKFQTIFDKNQMFLDQMAGKSKAWFFKQVDSLADKGITPRRLLTDSANNTKSKIIIGELYMYFYDPKTKDTLPYYDTFPMVFPFAPTKDGFIGLNMHYLPYDARIKLFEALDSFKNNKFYTDKTKLQLSWNAIKALSEFKLAEPCVKRYLYSHIKSPITKIDSVYWPTALLMPVERFKKSTKIGVWSNSIGGR